MNRLAVLGASGHGKVVGDAAMCSGWHDVVYFDDRWPEVRTLGPWSVIGNAQGLVRAQGEFDAAIVAIGDNRTRLLRQRELVAAGIVIATVIHPSAVVSRFARIGPGSVLCANTVVNPFALVGAAAIINTGATVDHDCELSDGVHISPGAHLGGAVRVGEAAWIGIGAAVRPGITIGERVVVGAGAAVVNDITDGIIVTGIPARAHKSNTGK